MTSQFNSPQARKLQTAKVKYPNRLITLEVGTGVERSVGVREGSTAPVRCDATEPVKASVAAVGKVVGGQEGSPAPARKGVTDPTQTLVDVGVIEELVGEQPGRKHPVRKDTPKPTQVPAAATGKPVGALAKSPEFERRDATNSTKTLVGVIGKSITIREQQRSTAAAAAERDASANAYTELWANPTQQGEAHKKSASVRNLAGERVTWEGQGKHKNKS